MKEASGFFAYASMPADIGQTIERSAANSAVSSGTSTISTWAELDIVGHFISDKVLEGIEYADFFIADISELNFNVTYEIGYAIGKSKRILLVKNKSIQPQGLKISDVGIFDTLGYKEYQNSFELNTFLNNTSTLKPIDVSVALNIKAPVYLLDTPHKTDWSTRIISRIKKAGFTFRNFDPNESPRLSAYDAINQVAQSYGVVVPLLSSHSVGATTHNMRAAFIAGLNSCSE